MTRAHFKLKNLRTLLVHRKTQKASSSVLKNICHNFANISINDRHNEHNRDKHPAERLIWFIIRVVAILGMTFIILDVTFVFKRSPTVTTPETEMFPMQKIDYPAIAICNINRISRRAAIDLAQELLEFESTIFNGNFTVTELGNMLKLMGQLYLSQLNEGDLEITKLLHTILERGYNGYNVNRIMKRLSPKCRYMLRKCFWEGKDQVCDDIFLLRKTQDGYCCTFNYARRNDGFGSAQNDVFASQHIQHSTNIGSEYGLSVLLNPQLDDYAYEILPINGFKILVYSPLDHPDASSGGVREILISPKTEAYIDLDAVLFYSTEDVQKYNIRERDCLFRTEQSKIFHGYYSFSDCIIHCRMRDILNLCNCVPFFYPITGNIASARICNLKDLPCLKKYKERWWNVKPRFENTMIPFDNNAFERSLDHISCDCLPSCTDVTYNVQTSTIPLNLSEMSWGRNKYAVKNHSVLHIYFGKNKVIRLRQDMLFYWYELMSNYGGICSLFLGINIINVIGILYDLILRIWNSDETIKTKTETKVNQGIANITTITVQPTTKPENTPIFYWREITGALHKEQFHSPNILLNPLLK